MTRTPDLRHCHRRQHIELSPPLEHGVSNLEVANVIRSGCDRVDDRSDPSVAI